MTDTGTDAFNDLLTQAQGYGTAPACRKYGYTAALQDVVLTDCPTTGRAAARATCLCSNDDAEITSLIYRNVESKGCFADLDGAFACAIYRDLCTLASDIERTFSLTSSLTGGSRS